MLVKKTFLSFFRLNIAVLASQILTYSGSTESQALEPTQRIVLIIICLHAKFCSNLHAILQTVIPTDRFSHTLEPHAVT